MKPKQQETKSEQKRRLEHEKEMLPLGRQETIKEGSECKSVDDWDDSLFMTATHFNVVIVSGSGRHSRTIETHHSYPIAVSVARQYPKMGSERTLVYAVNEEGRYACLPPDRWAHFQTLWEQMHPKFADQVFRLIEGWYVMKKGKVFGPFISEGAAEKHLAL